MCAQGKSSAEAGNLPKVIGDFRLLGENMLVEI